MSKSEHTTQDPPITPRRIRQRKIAQAVLAGDSYTQIAQAVAPDAKYPRQTIYESVQTAGVQEAIKDEMARSDYTKTDIREVISLVLQGARTRAREKGDISSSQSKVIEIASRTEAMLTDKAEVSQSFVPLTDVKDMSTDQLVNELTSRLRADVAGVRVNADK